MKTLAIIFSLLLVLSGCRSKDRDFVVFEQSLFRDVRTHIVKPEQALQAKNGARLEIEKRLAHEESENGKKDLRQILDHWDYYVCQVIGMRREGREILLLRFFPRNTQEEYDLTKSQIQIMDGGPSFWTIECDLEALTYSSLRINGVA
jgi:hypothetical protein